MRVPRHFPTVGEYATRLERGGFRADFIALIPRPTPLPGDVVGWLETFGESFTIALPSEARAEYLHEVSSALEPRLRDGLGLSGAIGIAVDAGNAYWTETGDSVVAGRTVAGAGRVAKCATGGCNDSPTVIAAQQDGPTEIAVDAAHVYWAAYGIGAMDGTLASLKSRRLRRTTASTLYIGYRPAPFLELRLQAAPSEVSAGERVELGSEVGHRRAILQRAEPVASSPGRRRTPELRSGRDSPGVARTPCAETGSGGSSFFREVVVRKKAGG